jgi:hypothetical protein
MNQAAFNLQAGEDLKATALDNAEKRNALELGRQFAREAALRRADRTATADDAARGFLRIGKPADFLGNSAGALFRGNEWEFTGRWQKSHRTTNHARQNRVWRLI